LYLIVFNYIKQIEKKEKKQKFTSNAFKSQIKLYFTFYLNNFLI